MRGFEPVTVAWKGETYTVEPDRMLMLIAQVEDALSGGSGKQAVQILTQSGGPNYSALSRAFGAALRYAGADVSDEEIYLSIMDDFADRKADVAVKVQQAIMALLAIIAPPIALALSGDDEKKHQPQDS